MESLGDFLQRLKILSDDCNFLDATASQCKESAVRDALIAGISSSYIRQRLLEDNVLQLNEVFDKARSLHKARKNAQFYNSTDHFQPLSSINSVERVESVCSAVQHKKFCGYCGGDSRKRTNCPAACCGCYKCG